MPKILNVLGDEVKTLEDLLEYIDEDDKAAILAAHAQHPSVAVPDEDDTLMVSFMLNRHPLVGGDYYRAYRAAALASNRFGWRTSLANRMVTKEDEPEGRLGFITPAPDDAAKVFFSDVLVIRPVANWRLSNVEQMHANGQKIIADVDDDPWGHEDLSNPDLTPIEDYYTEWLSHADAWLCSTKYLCRRLREHGCRADRVYYAPNLYDPTAMNADPKPGRRLGTRLWLGGRQDGDVAMYDELVFPLLDRLDCSFTHIGAMDDLEIAKVGQKLRRSFGWDTPRLIERPSVTIPEMPAELSRISIGTICMSDNEFNRAKTETHAAELALAGLPLVAASPHELYRNIPGVVALTPAAVERRVKDLIDPEVWHIESKRAKSWARSLAVKHESTYLEALLQAVNAITK